MFDMRNPKGGSGQERIGCSGAVLAGGESRRFGRDKARAILAGKPLVAHVVETLQILFEDVLIVTNQPVSYEHLDVTVVSDIVSGAGALGGLLTALLHADAERCFVAACDMPFLNVDVIRKMLGTNEGLDVVVPTAGGELQPLHAIYSRRCIRHIREKIAAGEFRIFDFYPEVLTFRFEEGMWKDADPENLSFVNINTQEDLERAHQCFKKSEMRGDAGRR